MATESPSTCLDSTSLQVNNAETAIYHNYRGIRNCTPQALQEKLFSSPAQGPGCRKATTGTGGARRLSRWTNVRAGNRNKCRVVGGRGALGPSRLRYMTSIFHGSTTLMGFTVSGDFESKNVQVEGHLLTWRHRPGWPSSRFLPRLCVTVLHTHRYHPPKFGPNLSHDDGASFSCACCLLLKGVAPPLILERGTESYWFHQLSDPNPDHRMVQSVLLHTPAIFETSCPCCHELCYISSAMMVDDPVGVCSVPFHFKGPTANGNSRTSLHCRRHAQAHFYGRPHSCVRKLVCYSP